MPASKPHGDEFVRSKMLISRNKKYFMTKEKKVPDYRHSLDAVFEKHDKFARHKVWNNRTVNFLPMRVAPL